MILPDEYVRAVGKAVRSYGGLFVLDCIASGTAFVDMQKNNVDVIISAPQKAWSGPACCALVMLSGRARDGGCRMSMASVPLEPVSVMI